MSRSSNDLSIIDYFRRFGNTDRRYEYLEKFIKNYKPLRSGTETPFLRRKNYYKNKFFDELRNFTDEEKKHWEAEFYCRELEKLTKYYYIIDYLKTQKDFQLEINVELFENLIKCDYKILDCQYLFNRTYNKDIECFYLSFNNEVICNNSSIFYLTLIIFLSFLLEKDIKEVKNIESLKSMYYVFKRNKITIFSVYKMINWIYEYMFKYCNRFFNREYGVYFYNQITPEGLYDYMHNFFKEADKIFIKKFTDNLQYLID